MIQMQIELTEIVDNTAALVGQVLERCVDELVIEEDTATKGAMLAQEQDVSVVPLPITFPLQRMIKRAVSGV